MAGHIAVIAVLGLAPVIVLLVALLALDSFKLTSLASVLEAMLLGLIAAAVTYYVSAPVMDATHLSFEQYSRFGGPVLEESLKASAMLYLFARNRIGFMVDAAILGLALGAGFAVCENVYYAVVFPDANLGIWLARGLGTAIMHAGATAIFGVTAQNLSERHARINPLNYLPGLVAAIALHMVYNQYIGLPIISTALMIFVVPLLLLFVFDKSEHEAHDWLVHDFASHEHLLEAIRDGTFAHSEAGRLIASLAERFGKDEMADIFAYLALHTELVLEAEKRLLAHERGEAVPPADGDREKFARLHALEKKIGRTAMLTIWPHLKFSHTELWELHQLEAEARRKWAGFRTRKTQAA